jgi:hypothetical protein
MSIGQTIKHIGTILLITLAVAAQAQQAQTYDVAGCEFLNMREGPASTYPINQRLQSGVNGIVLIGKPVFNGATKWQQVNSRDVIGWVNAYYIKESIQPQPAARPVAVTPIATPEPEPLSEEPQPLAVSELQTTIESLRKDNAALRHQLQTTADAVRIASALPVDDTEVSVNKSATEEYLLEFKDDGGDSASSDLSYTISSTGKRHNSNCRYYGKGRPSGPTDGIACKICGG